MLWKLGAEDIQGLSKKALIKEKKEETIQIYTIAGMNEIQISKEDTFDNVPAAIFNLHLAIGEGHRILS